MQSTQAVALVANRVSKSEDDPAAALALYARAVVEIAAEWRSDRPARSPARAAGRSQQPVSWRSGKLQGETDRGTG